MSEEPRSLWAKINYIQNISNWLKPYQSVLLTVTLMLMYIVLGATIFFRFGVPLEMHRKMWAAGEISLAIEEHTHQIWRSLNQSSNNFSVEWLIRKELSQLGDKIITFTGSVMYRNETDFDWGMSEAAVHSLCLMTAIGSCVTTPPTTFARSIGILYGMLGLPLAVLTVGNVGKFIGKGSAEAYHFIKNQISQRLKKEEDYHNNNNIKSDVDLNDDKIHRVTLDLVLVLFLIYLVVGAVLLPDYRDENFLSAIFLCFVSLTTVAVTDNHASYTLLYLLFGMALTSIALEVAANYLRKVHFMGRKMCNAPSVAVHFGGKDLTVSELFWAFGRENGLHDDVMLKFICRMDDFVATTIAQKESGELRKPNILLRKSLLCENLGVSSGDISFADDSESEV